MSLRVNQYKKPQWTMKPIRNAEVRGSIPLCSTSKLNSSTTYKHESDRPEFPIWPISGQKKQQRLVKNSREGEQIRRRCLVRWF